MLNVSFTVESIAGLPPRPVITVCDEDGNVVSPLRDDAHKAIQELLNNNPQLAQANYLIKAS
jgi:hypothetical protein